MIAKEESEWTDIICPICGKKFGPRSWKNRHTVPFGRYQGEDCHPDCCQKLDCVKDRSEKRKRIKHNEPVM